MVKKVKKVPARPKPSAPPFFMTAPGNLISVIGIVVGAALLLRHPGLVQWLGDDTAKKILSYADDTVKLGIPTLLGILTYFVHRNFLAIKSLK